MNVNSEIVYPLIEELTVGMTENNSFYNYETKASPCILSTHGGKLNLLFRWGLWKITDFTFSKHVWLLALHLTSIRANLKRIICFKVQCCPNSLNNSKKSRCILYGVFTGIDQLMLDTICKHSPNMWQQTHLFVIMFLLVLTN